MFRENHKAKKNEILAKTVKHMKDKESRREEAEKMVLKTEKECVKEVVNIEYARTLLLD